MKATRNLAFLGGGLNSAVGYTHFLASQLDGYFHVVAGAFSRDPAINLRSGQRYGINESRIYPDLASILDSQGDNIDALVVLTPTPDHCHDVRQALDSGINVICEKALATNSDGARDLATAAAKAGRHCVVTFNYTGYPAVREMRRQIQCGEIGDLIQIAVEMPQEGFLREGASAQNWRLKDYQIPTVSLDLGVHVVHLTEYLAAPGKIKGVRARQQHNGLVNSVIDNVNAIVEYHSGAVASFWWSKTALGHRNGLRVRVYGTKGSMEWSQMNPEEILVADQSGTRRIIDRGAPPPDSEFSQSSYNRFKAGHPAGFVEAFANIYRDFHPMLASPVSESVDSHYGVNKAIDGLELLEEIHRQALTTWE